jgi:mono/diheme cytochrome c family protein
VTHRIPFAACAAIALAASASTAVAADPAVVARGKYLVTIASCHDCHTPGYFLGKPDMVRYLGGSDVGFELAGLGVFYGPNLTPDKETGLGVFHGPNLTPDKETGLGNWTDAQVLTALQTGVRPDGRVLAPIMPWRAFASLTKQDAEAIVAFLRSVPPVSHNAPGPFGPTETPTSFVMKVVPPATK